MSLKGLNRHQQKVARKIKQREHPNRQRLSKDERTARQARVDFKKRKENAYERERTADTAL